ncbi:class I lanthipeptide [Chitinophaga flava]|nr:class I lanthipeptide [Chitinophaga flava]
MKKKQVSLQKKLILGKSTVATLNASQQQLIAGGLPTVTRILNCPSNADTCATIPPGGHACQICQTE